MTFESHRVCGRCHHVAYFMIMTVYDIIVWIMMPKQFWGVHSVES